jgi:hypothetical protein
VEGSKFCLFSVILPAMCVSNVSPRFHYRRLSFCFLPLAAILESSLYSFLNWVLLLNCKSSLYILYASSLKTCDLPIFSLRMWLVFFHFLNGMF